MSVQWCSHPKLKKKITRKKKSSSSQRFKTSFFLWRDSKISLWISQFSNQVSLSWLKHCLELNFILLKTIMEPLLCFLGNYISCETKSKMNEQREAQKTVGAARHSEFSGNLLSMATLLNTHFQGRRQTFPTVFTSQTAKHLAVPLRKEYSEKAICGWVLNPRKLRGLPLWVKKPTRHVFFS